MADASTDSTGDAPPSGDETLMERAKLLWDNNWSTLVKALVVSVGLHLLLALPVVFHPALPGDFEIEWEGRMGELSAIGHGSAQFDDRHDVDFDEMADFRTATVDEDDEPEEQQQDEEPDPDDAPAEEQPDDEPPEQPDEIGEDPDEEPGDEQLEEEPGEPAPTPQQDDSADGPGDEPAEEPADEPTPQPAEHVAEDGVPGIERAGPSNLPDMRDYGPGNARVTSLVRIDRIRGSDFEPYVDDLIRAIPDYRIALDGTGFDPVADIDSFFMATANPEYVQHTFLAVRHRVDNDELQQTLDDRFRDELPWEIDDGRPVRRLVPDSMIYHDPRRLVLAQPGLALIGQPHWLEELMSPVDENSELGRELAAADGGPSAFTLLDGVSRIEESVDDDEDLLMVVSAYGARLPNVRGLGVDLSGLPTFHAARLAISDATDPRVTIDLRMRNEATARQFNERCPNLVRQLSRSFLLRAMDMARYLEPLECRLEGDYVVVEAQYDGDSVRELLDRLPEFIDAGTPAQVANLPPAPGAQDEPPPAVDDGDETSPADESIENSGETDDNEEESSLENPSR